MTINLDLRHTTSTAFFYKKEEYDLMVRLHYAACETIRLYVYRNALIVPNQPKSNWGIDTANVYYNSMMLSWCKLFYHREPTSYDQLANSMPDKIKKLYGSDFSAQANAKQILSVTLKQRHQVPDDEYKKFEKDTKYIRDKDLVHWDLNPETLEKLEKEQFLPMTEFLAKTMFGLLTILVDILNTYPASPNCNKFCVRYNRLGGESFEDYMKVDPKINRILKFMKGIDQDLHTDQDNASPYA